jgi:hypothetical protein
MQQMDMQALQNQMKQQPQASQYNPQAQQMPQSQPVTDYSKM